MAQDFDRAEAKKTVSELRGSASRLLKRSKQLEEEALRLQQRADDLDQIIKQRDARKSK